VGEGISSELLPQPTAAHWPAGSRRAEPGSARLSPLSPLWSGPVQSIVPPSRRDLSDDPEPGGTPCRGISAFGGAHP
jgi:hypothetical protein